MAIYQPNTTKTHAAVENIGQNLPVFGEKSANLAKFRTDMVKSRTRQNFFSICREEKFTGPAVNFGDYGQTFS
jgi:hypothetical protein